MKNCVQRAGECANNGNKIGIWRKIGLNTKFQPQQDFQQQNQRYETSLGLLLLAQEQAQNQINKEISSSSITKQENLGKDSFNSSELERQLLLTKAKFTESYCLQAKDNEKGCDPQTRLCFTCQVIMTPILQEIKVKLKLYANEYNKMKQKVTIQLQKFQEQILTFKDQAILLLKKSEKPNFQIILDEIEGSEQKLNFIEQENQKRYQKMEVLQNNLNELKKQCNFLNNYYLSIKLSSITQKKLNFSIKRDLDKLSNLQSASHILETEHSYHQRKQKNNSESSDESDLSQSNKIQKQKILKSSQQIQNLKKKLKILKNKLCRQFSTC